MCFIEAPFQMLCIDLPGDTRNLFLSQPFLIPELQKMSLYRAQGKAFWSSLSMKPSTTPFDLAVRADTLKPMPKKKIQFILSNSSVNVCWHKRSLLIHHNVVFSFVNCNAQVYIFGTAEVVTSKKNMHSMAIVISNQYITGDDPVIHWYKEQTARAKTIKYYH